MANEKFEVARVACLRGDHADHDKLYHAFCETVQALYRAQEDVENARMKFEERQRDIKEKDAEIKELEHKKAHMEHMREELNAKIGEFQAHTPE